MPSLQAVRRSNPAYWISMDYFGCFVPRNSRNDDAPNL